MDRITVKNLILCSGILGLLLGILAAVPVIGIWMLATVIILAAPCVIVYLIMDGKLDLTTVKDSILQGALAGFCASIFFSSAYSVSAVILFKTFQYTDNQILTSIITNSPLWLLLCFIVFIGIFNAVTNAFSGVVTYYVINFIRDMYEKSHPQTAGNGDFRSIMNEGMQE